MSVFLDVARIVLRAEGKPMSALQITQAAAERRLLPDNLVGATPHQTMKAKLSVHIRRYGELSVFVRTAPGRFFLRELLTGVSYAAPPQRPPGGDELVVTIPSESVAHRLSRTQGLNTRVHSLPARLAAAPWTLTPRLNAEAMDDRRQLLTYIVVTRGDQVLSYRRGNFNLTAEYLRGSLCIGFGGHVSGDDASGLWGADDAGIFRGAARELQEELRLPTPDVKRLEDPRSLEVVGLLNDESSDVGRRHIAVVLRYEVSSDPAWETPMRGEKSIRHLAWLTPSDADFQMHEMEYWSQLCVRTMFREAARATPVLRVRRKSRLRPPHMLCVIGGVGSGKTVATHELSQNGYSVINSGHVLAEMLGVPPIPSTPREDFQKLAREFIASLDGPVILGRELAQRADVLNTDRVLVDGIRHVATLDEIRRSWGRRLGVVFVYTPPDLSFRFYRSRQRDHTGEETTIEKFLELRSAPVEQEVDVMIRKADAILYNWAGLGAYRRAVRQLVQGPWVAPAPRRPRTRPNQS